jgi:hypothetical protein
VDGVRRPVRRPFEHFHPYAQATRGPKIFALALTGTESQKLANLPLISLVFPSSSPPSADRLIFFVPMSFPKLKKKIVVEGLGQIR